MREGFLDKNVRSGSGRGERGRDVERIGIGNDHGLGPVAQERIGEVVEHGVPGMCA